jgi:poly-gamma-glutamate capsule biosynthesis protein CapA/YwtB (metallophosphatase superfamily)
MKFLKTFSRGALILALLAFSGCTRAPKVTLTFGGDIILARDGKALFGPINPWQNVEASIEDQQKGADQTFFFANLESPISEKRIEQVEGFTEGYDLCADAAQLDVLKQGKVNFVNLANNHQNDCGTEAFQSSSKLLEAAGVRSVGPEMQATYLETGAGKIGLLSADDVTQAVDDDKLIDTIQKMRSKCDILIVSLHWGNEYQSGISERQKELAQTLANAGVDVLWGTHPHVLQPVQWIKAESGAHKMLAMFSLGNLLSDQWMTRQTQETALITLTIHNKQIVGFSVLPLQMDRSSRQLVLPGKEQTQTIKDRLGLDKFTTSWKN